jgi:hypothetical protein
MTERGSKEPAQGRKRGIDTVIWDFQQWRRR